MRSAMQSDKKGLTARDLVTCGVFIALYFVFMMVGSMLFAPNPVLTFLCLLYTSPSPRDS